MPNSKSNPFAEVLELYDIQSESVASTLQSMATRRDLAVRAWNKRPHGMTGPIDGNFGMLFPSSMRSGPVKITGFDNLYWFPHNMETVGFGELDITNLVNHMIFEGY